MYSIHPHAERQAKSKGFTLAAVLEAANNPSISYPSGRFPGQLRRIRDGIVAVCDPMTWVVVTVYENVVETSVRADQTDRDAQRYAQSHRVIREKMCQPHQQSVA